jgi:hypothetical protein
MDNLFFQNLSISNLIDPYVFKTNLAKLQNIEIFRYSNAQSSNEFSVEQGQWKSKRYRTIDQTKVKEKINQILKVKSHMIVDSSDEKLEKLMGNYLKNTRYKVVTTEKTGKKTTYTLSSVTREISELKIPSKSFFIMKSSDEKYPHIIAKKYLDSFMVYYSELK